MAGQILKQLNKPLGGLGTEHEILDIPDVVKVQEMINDNVGSEPGYVIEQLLTYDSNGNIYTAKVRGDREAKLVAAVQYADGTYDVMHGIYDMTSDWTTYSVRTPRNLGATAVLTKETLPIGPVDELDPTLIVKRVAIQIPIQDYALKAELTTEVTRATNKENALDEAIQTKIGDVPAGTNILYGRKSGEAYTDANTWEEIPIGVPEAPLGTDVLYARKSGKTDTDDNEWTELVIPDAIVKHDTTLTGDGTDASELKVVNPMPALPDNNDKQYVIKNKAWTEVILPDGSVREIVFFRWYDNPNRGVQVQLKGNTVGKFWLYGIVYGSSPQVRHSDGDYFINDDVTEYELYDSSLVDGHHFVEQVFITNKLLDPAITASNLGHDPSIVYHADAERYFEVKHDSTLDGEGNAHNPLTVKVAADKMFDYRLEEYKFSEITPESGIFDRVTATLSGDTTTTFYMYGVYRETSDDTDYGIKLDAQYHMLFGVMRTSYELNHNGIPFKALRVLSNPLGQDRLEDFDILRNEGLVRSYYPPSLSKMDVRHDTSLSGKGTADDELKVVNPVPALPTNDGKSYGIKDKQWSEVLPKVEHDTTLVGEGTAASVLGLNTPTADDKSYGIVNKSWALVTPLSPSGGAKYLQQSGGWVQEPDYHYTVFKPGTVHATNYVVFFYIKNSAVVGPPPYYDLLLPSDDMTTIGTVAPITGSGLMVQIQIEPGDTKSFAIVKTGTKIVGNNWSNTISELTTLYAGAVTVPGGSGGTPDVPEGTDQRYVRHSGNGTTTQAEWESIDGDTGYVKKLNVAGNIRTNIINEQGRPRIVATRTTDSKSMTTENGVSSSRGPEFMVYDDQNNALVFRNGKGYITPTRFQPTEDERIATMADVNGAGDLSNKADKIELNGGTMPIKTVGRDRPVATGRFSSWNPYPDTPPSMSDTSALSNWFMARWYEGNDDEKYIGVMHVSAGDVAFNFTPQSGSDTIVENGIYVIELNVNEMSYRVVETWFDGSDWLVVGGFPQNYSYIFPDNTSYLMTDPHDFTSSFLGSGYSMWEAPNVKFNLKDVAYSRPTQSGSAIIGAITHWVPYPYDSLIGSYQPLALFEGDELYVQGDLQRDISAPVRLYSIDHSFYIEHTMDHKILIVFDNEVLQTLENQGDTYRCIGFSAMDWMGIKGSQEDLQRVSTDLYIRGPAAIATVEDALTAVSDTASRSQYTVQIKKESLYHKVSDIMPLDPQRTWRVYNPIRMEETPVGVSNIIYVDGWKDSSSTGEYHYLCVAEDGIYASDEPVDENSWTKISGGGGAANFPFTTPAYDGNVAATIPLIRTDPTQTSMSRGRMHSTMRLQVRPSGSNTFRTEIGQYRQASTGGDDDTIGDEDYAAGIGFSGNAQTSGSKVELLWGAAKRMRENDLSDLGDNEVVSIARLKKATGNPDIIPVRESEWGGSKTKMWVNSISDYMNQRGEIRAFKAGYYSVKSYNDQDRSAHSETKQVLSFGTGASGTGGIQEFLPVDLHLGGNNIDIANVGQTKMAIGFEWNVIKPNAADIDDQWPNRWSGLFNVGYTGNSEPTYGDNSNFMSGWFVSDEDKAAMKGATDLGSGVFIPAGNKLVTVEYMNERLAALEARIAALEAR